jgi:hypothetical protein
VIQRFYKHHRPERHADELVFVTRMDDGVVEYVTGDGSKHRIDSAHFHETIKYPDDYAAFATMSGGSGPRFSLITHALEAK